MSAPPVFAGTPSLAARILVAEDTLDNQLVIRAFLKHRPYVLVFVADGKAALAQCSENEFDAVLMDVQMPVMDGLTAARAIREIEAKHGRRPVPILALTGNDSREDIEDCRLAGCTAHLSKPFSKAALLDAVDDLLKAEPIPITPPEGLESLAPRYLSARRKELPELAASLAACDFEHISSLGHNMKGTGCSYGFPDLTDIGAALERFAQHEDKEEIGKQLARLANYLESVRLPVSSFTA